MIIKLFPVIVIFRTEWTEMALFRPHNSVTRMIFDRVSGQRDFAREFLIALFADKCFVHNLNVLDEMVLLNFNSTSVT